MRWKLYPNVTPVTTGLPAQVRLPVPGPTIDRIQLRWGATGSPGLAGMTNIKVVVDGNLIQEFADAGVLDSINQYHGRDAATGAGTVASPYASTIYFRRPEVASFLGLSEVSAERFTALRTGNIKSAWVEFTITGAGAFCTVFADEQPTKQAEPSGSIVRVKKFSYNGIAGTQDILSEIPRGNRQDGGTGIICVHLKKADIGAAANGYSVTVKESGYAVFDSVSKEALQEFANEDGKVPVAGYTVIDFCSNGSLDDLLAVHPDRDLRATVGILAGAAYDVYVEYLDRVGSGL